MNNDFNEQFLNSTYDKFNQEQTRIMNDLKNEGEEAKLFEKLYQQQVHILHRMLMDMIKLRNLKTRIEEKKNNIVLQVVTLANQGILKVQCEVKV